MAIFRTAHYSVRPDTLDTCTAALHTIVDSTRKEPGTLIYVVLQDTADPTHFVHFSAYADEAALATHIGGEPMGTQIREVLQPAMIEAPEFTHYTVVQGKLAALPVI